MQKRATEIIVKWADLESSGKLQTQTESNLEAEFLTQVFGEAWATRCFPKGRRNGTSSPSSGSTIRPPMPPSASSRRHGSRAPRRDRAQGSHGQRGPGQIQRAHPRPAVLGLPRGGPRCPWGIVSNIVSFRLYHRARRRGCMSFSPCRTCADAGRFRQFYCLFERGGLLPLGMARWLAPMCCWKSPQRRQREVGDELYG